ncbi:MAG: AI-2E family transporter [Haloferacaceae archaeon]
MTFSRRHVLGGLFVALLLIAAALLADVIGTVFFAITVAYLLSPVRRRLRERGLSRRWASVVTTSAAFVGTMLLLSPLVVILVLRFDELLAALRTIPDEIAVSIFGMAYSITTEQALATLITLLEQLARQALAESPILLTKLALFVFLIFSLLHHQGHTRQAILAVVPPSYRSVADALGRRARETLFAIYVLQAATAAGTFLIALPVFVVLGYSFPITLAVSAALLQFLPIVGPSLLLLGLAGWHVVFDQPVAAFTVLLVGGFFIAWLPDLLIRPRLARQTADLSGSLYFIGFVGGLLTMGPIGVIAGPLAVALVVEMARLLADELNRVPVVER